MRLVVDVMKMTPGDWLGDSKHIWPVKKLHCLSQPKVLYGEDGLANLGSLRQPGAKLGQFKRLFLVLKTFLFGEAAEHW